MRLPLSLDRGRDRSRDPLHLAEVIETQTAELLAQCLEPATLEFPIMPPFGSWVRAYTPDSKHWVYAVIYQVSTRPLDTIHRTRALGLSLEELQREQPQIFALLKTEFQAAIVGFQDAQGRIRQYLPPRPPPVHQAVYRCTSEEVIAFSDRLDFVPTLLNLSAAPVDALIASILREGYQIRKADRPWLVAAARSLATFLREDYDRLRLILKQIHLD